MKTDGESMMWEDNAARIADEQAFLDRSAIAAMQGMTTNPYWDEKTFDSIALQAFEQARMLLAERRKNLVK